MIHSGYDNEDIGNDCLLRFLVNPYLNVDNVCLTDEFLELLVDSTEMTEEEKEFIRKTNQYNQSHPSGLEVSPLNNMAHLHIRYLVGTRAVYFHLMFAENKYSIKNLLNIKEKEPRMGTVLFGIIIHLMYYKFIKSEYLNQYTIKHFESNYISLRGEEYSNVYYSSSPTKTGS